MSQPTETPWGAAQHTREIAPGIVRHDTASHGGYYVSPERLAEMPEPLRKFSPWAEPSWYEEDCDWCIVALAFPQHFPADHLPLAEKVLERYQPEVFAEWKAWRASSHDQIRSRHFERLNAYRHTAEYAAFAKSIGNEPPDGPLPSLLNDRWEIDDAIYYEFLNMLPPLGWKGGAFYMCEFTFDDITTKFSREGGRFFCEFARYPGKQAA